MAQKSIYRELPSGCHEIRVLQPEQLSSSSDGLLKYTLEYIVLDDNRASRSSFAPVRGDGPSQSKRQKTTSSVDSRYATPPYIALSYTWGDPKDVTPIQVAGTEKMVTKSLRDALTALSAEPRTASLPVWADAVSINQDDFPERDREVKRMAVIYERAANVIVWLGYVPKAWNFHGLASTENVNNILPRLLMDQEPEATDNGQRDLYTGDEILTLVAIFECPYWRRIWIFQELVSARFEDIFFFWAGGLRHISVLGRAHHTFPEIANAWLDSEDTSNFLRSFSAPAKRVFPTTPKTSRPGMDLKDDRWRAASIRSSANRAHAKLGQTQSASGMAEGIMQAVINGQTPDPSKYMRKYSSSDIVQKMMQASFTGSKLDIKDYLSKNSQQHGDNSSSTIKQEIEKMASGMKEELRKMEELLQAITVVGNDGEWDIKQAEIKLAISGLTLTAMDMISAASLDKSKENVDFGLLMRHALHGQCSKDIDRVYGLLGLHSQEIMSQITVNYNWTSERVFSDFSAAAISSKGLNFLCEYGVNLTGATSSLPSWAIGLSNLNEASMTDGQWSRKWKKFNAGGAKRDPFQFSADNSRLHCPALLFRVDMLQPRTNYSSRDEVRNALERVVSCHHPDEEQRRSTLNISPESISNDPEVTACLEICREFRAVHSDFAIEGWHLDDLFTGLDDIVAWDLKEASQVLKSMRSQIIFTTADGKLGLGGDKVRNGDYVAVLQGCNVPVVLRECNAGYCLIGMCYVDGLMLGEALGANLNWAQIVIL